MTTAPDRETFLPAYVDIVPGSCRCQLPKVTPAAALAYGQDVIITLHHDLRARPSRLLSELHALAIEHAREAGSVHVRGGNESVREGVVTVVLAALSGSNVRVTTTDPAGGIKRRDHRRPVVRRPAPEGAGGSSPPAKTPRVRSEWDVVNLPPPRK